MATSTVSTATFTRDRFTWLAYFMLSFFAYSQAALGPAMPFLRTELALSYALAGLHISAFAVGMIGAGLTGNAVVRRLGRPPLFWGGGAAMAAGTLLLLLGRSAPLTVTGTLIMGWGGTYMMSMVQSTLSDRHGPRRATALTEANVAASATTIFPPLLIGAFAGTLIGWRAAFIVSLVAWGIAALFNRSVPLPLPRPIPTPTAADSAPSDRLPRAFWLYWLAMLLLVSIEWSVVAWSADFMASEVGLARGLAAGLMSAFFLAMVVGRFAGSRLTRRVEAVDLLPAAVVIAAVGFLFFWQSPIPALNVAGLFVAGLGIANMFPLCLSVATTIADARSDAASTRLVLAGGIAILVTPQVLGTLADSVGLGAAFGLLTGLFVAAMAMVLVGRRAVNGQPF